MPHASVIRTQSGITLAMVALIGGAAVALLLIAGWVLAIVAFQRTGSPGVITLVAILFAQLGAMRLIAERRVDVLATQFPQAFMLHVAMTGAQRKRLLAFANDAGLNAQLPVFGGRFALVATAEWVRIYRGSGNPTIAIEIPLSRLDHVSFVTKKSIFATQSLLSIQLTGSTQTWLADLSALFFGGISPKAIPAQFYAEELAAMSAKTHPAAR